MRRSAAKRIHSLTLWRLAGWALTSCQEEPTEAERLAIESDHVISVSRFQTGPIHQPAYREYGKKRCKEPVRNLDFCVRVSTRVRPSILLEVESLDPPRALFATQVHNIN